MSPTLRRILDWVDRGEVRVSDHGYDELAADGILFREVLETIHDAKLVEDYPDYPKGPCVLLLHRGDGSKPIHAVWGIPGRQDSPAVLVTAYRPDPSRWSPDFLKRKQP